ncbi:hypothetical protein T06_13985 [Trichinella sp. T6]|nr:hypothetical protein T06_13985 [Trichinella sp. T6]
MDRKLAHFGQSIFALFTPNTTSNLDSVVLLGLENKPCWCRFLHAGWGRRSLSHAPVHQWIRPEGQQHQAPERTTKSSNQFRTLVSFHCFPTRQLTGTGATLANTCSHKAAPNVSAPDANAYGARRPRSTCQKRHKQLISNDMLKHEAEHKQLFRTAGVQNKNKTHNNVLVDVISCQITASTIPQNEFQLVVVGCQSYLSNLLSPPTKCNFDNA